MSGLNLFAYGSDDDGSDEKEEMVMTEETKSRITETSKKKSLLITYQLVTPVQTEKKKEEQSSPQSTSSSTNVIENNEKESPQTISTEFQPKKEEEQEPSAKRARIQPELKEDKVEPKIVAADSESAWVKVHDPKTNKDYYWNKQTNKTTWKCPECLKQSAVSTQSLQPKSSPQTQSTSAKPESSSTLSTSYEKSRQVISSGVTFLRCKGCGGWGKDLLLPTGFCAYCSQKGNKKQSSSTITAQTQSYTQSYAQSHVQSQQSSSNPVYSRASEILGMQPKLRMYKKRPESNIPLSRRTKQAWETDRVDPLSLGNGEDGPKFRKHYRG